MTTLQRSYDRKVTPLAHREARKDRALIGNSFGLPAGDSCPGMTEFCKGCYAKSTENNWSSVAALVRRNFDTLLAHGDDIQAIAADLAEMLTGFTAEFDRALARGLVVEADRIFRWHWDGDIYSMAYAKAIAIVCRRTPEIQHWLYTRSFDYVGALVRVPNVVLYLSVDEYNEAAAMKVRRRYPERKFPNLKVAACAGTISAAKTLQKTAVACPENVRRLPLVVAWSGKRTETVEVGDNAQGACSACRMCIDGTRDVAFATSHR